MNVRANKWFCVAVGGIVIAGCSDLGSPIKLSPELHLSVSSLDYGTVVVGQSESRGLGISNTGNADLNGFVSESCPDYSLDQGGGAFTVPPGGSVLVIARFQPSAVGSSSCDLSLGSGLPTVRLFGTGALQATGAVCAVSVPSLDFGTVAVGANKLGAFTAYSVGTVPVTLDVVSSCGEFTILAGGGPHTLAPGDSLPVSLRFAPGAGGHFACTVATGPGCPDVAVTGDATTVSFATQVLPIFNGAGCNGCHVFRRTTDIVNVTSQLGYAPAVLVKPFDPANSVLYNKVANTGLYGQPMPQGSVNGLPPSQRTTIRTWILEGAHDN